MDFSMSIDTRKLIQAGMAFVSEEGNLLHFCPHCYTSYYKELYSTSTALAWTPIYKDGVLQNRNPNVTTVHCSCMNCGQDFTYKY